MSFIRYPLGGEYHVQFTARRSWMANIYYQGKLFDIVPVTWTPDLSLTDRTLWVHFTSEDKMHEVRKGATSMSSWRTPKNTIR
jgi:hypothetical protein